MLTRDLFAVANFLVIITYSTRTINLYYTKRTYCYWGILLQRYQRLLQLIFSVYYWLFHLYDCFSSLFTYCVQKNSQAQLLQYSYA